MRAIRVTQFQRRAAPGAFSIERLFETVRSALPAGIEVRVQTNRFLSLGVLPRLLDALEARRRAGAVNHVLGDVHYLMWFLPHRGSVLTVHDCVSLERLSGVRRAALWFFWYWLPLARAEHVTVVSEFTRTEVANAVPGVRGKLEVIPPPLPAEFVASPAPRRQGPLRLLQVGTTENKNLPRVIQACRGLPVTLEIIGKLPEGIGALLDDVGVRYSNHVGLGPAELLEAYRRNDALILASTYEGFGMPIIEAQAVGRPVITSRICSMPEAAGGAACLVDPFDPSDIRRGIRRLLDDPAYAAELVRAGYENAARYSPERIARAYADVYRRAHDRAARGSGAPLGSGKHAARLRE
jgi:glycosyltransferase involved in cell wall biosynthesis